MNIVRNPDAKCANCAFWQARGEDETGNYVIGDCRFNEPEVPIAQEADEGIRFGVWPKTGDRMWCRKHSAFLQKEEKEIVGFKQSDEDISSGAVR